MLKILIPTLLLLPISWISPKKWMWTSTTSNSLLIASLSLIWFKWDFEMGWNHSNLFLGVDPLSAPLLALTCWLLPLMLLASLKHLSSEPHKRQQIYVSLLITLQALLITAFSATEMILFYIAFEATLIPTLIIITRWGNQTERLNAGVYFLFYTLAGSLPLLIALLTLQKDLGTLSMLILQYPNYNNPLSWTNKFWWVACLLAFLVKMPLYGVHLWLPKAHVEAPIAGSMILAAVLLKLGGYGMMRIIVVLNPLTKEMAYPFLILAIWGIVMTSSICLRQTDLKSLIAYSSVSHMGLVAAAILIQTPWSFAGATALMIAHGLISSMLFCLANTNYERIHSRTLLLARGTQIILPLMGTSWFLANLANLALPPSPNLMGELLIISSLFKWSNWTIILTGTGMLLTASYSLYMFLMTQRGPTPQHLLFLTPSYTREHLLMYLHLLPTILIITKPDLILGWTF
uniref:NADH-ubiquinone oxidoreductase chain 4 n=1 Tax=Beringraja pulchra TaxID=1885022 RepID=A0A0H4JDE9_BERPU|nr:NADH dehydrogenase subunit 4 [Beringraja pulchra]AHA03932.1 NADH dehydrogenase subunit 4 [Beringraja pulchra]AKO71912.1 NADH dehydrogenase subunit 4 [Beringraja pulchra]AKO71925.1 NADH dehydrogenase subunit 4 [Beringraja pulchra]AKO71964.1 NADH dehydrogenase subunit 4 [Beringraja pulchra]AYJ22444.1 NADH dehydrogenase subunit 4 [Beringraja pulchra]